MRQVGSNLLDMIQSGAAAATVTSTPTPVKETPKPTPAVSSGSAVTPFKLADIGEGIAEVELMKWFVKVKSALLLSSTNLSFAERR